MNTPRKDGLFIFIIGCAAIGLAVAYCVYTYSNKRSMRVGAPPEQRGFVLDVANQPASSFAADLDDMRNVHATAVLFVANPTESALPAVVSNAISLNLVPWLAIPPTKKPDAYRANAEEAAKFCADHNVGYLVLGLRLSSSFGEEAYWTSLLTSIRKSTPNVQIVFVSDYENYSWCTWWNQSDILGVSDPFPMPDKVAGDSDKLKGIFENSWANNIHDIIAFALRDTTTGLPRGAAIFDATIPKGYTPAAEEFYLRGLLHQSKRQPPKEKTESPAAGRDPLTAIFLGGWKTQLQTLRPTIKSEWDESAITYTEVATAPATTSATTEETTTNP